MRTSALALGLSALIAWMVSSPTAWADDANEESDFQVYPYLGLAIDNFAASDTSDYLNPGESGESKTRETFGIAFQYRLFDNGWPESRKNADLASTQRKQVEHFNGITIYGQTTHGVRSTDVDCEANPEVPLCVPFGPEVIAAQNDPTKRALYILRNASSLEATVGLRYEFLSLRNRDASVYTSVQYGLVAVQDDDDDVADVNHVAIGARIRVGRYRDSFVELAKGKNDLFSDHPNDRTKIIARLVTRPEKLKTLVFAHIVADVDGSDGADSVQTYLGVAFCFGKKLVACDQDN
jgi:hypothetical protein